MGRKRPIAVAIDSQVEALADATERLLEALDEHGVAGSLFVLDLPIVNATERLKEFRRAWLAEQTARAER